MGMQVDFIVTTTSQFIKLESIHTFRHGCSAASYDCCCVRGLLSIAMSGPRPSPTSSKGRSWVCALLVQSDPLGVLRNASYNSNSHQLAENDVKTYEGYSHLSLLEL